MSERDTLLFFGARSSLYGWLRGRLLLVMVVVFFLVVQALVPWWGVTPGEGVFFFLSFSYFHSDTVFITPPFIFVLTQALYLLGAGSVFWYRIPPLLASLGSVVLAFLLGERLKDKNAGLFASMMMTLTPGIFFFSRVNRQYSFLLFFSLLSLFAALRAYSLAREKSTGRYDIDLFLFVALVLVLSSHYYAVAVAVTVLSWGFYLMLFGRARDKRAGRVLFLTSLLALVVLSPLLLGLFSRGVWIKHTTSGTGGMNLETLYGVVSSFLVYFFFSSPLAGVLCTVSVILGAIYLWRYKKTESMPLFGLLFFTLGLQAFSTLLFIPAEFYAMAAIGPIILLSGVGLSLVSGWVSRAFHNTFAISLAWNLLLSVFIVFVFSLSVIQAVEYWEYRFFDDSGLVDLADTKPLVVSSWKLFDKLSMPLALEWSSRGYSWSHKYVRVDGSSCTTPLWCYKEGVLENDGGDKLLFFTFNQTTPQERLLSINRSSYYFIELLEPYTDRERENMRALSPDLGIPGVECEPVPGEWPKLVRVWDCTLGERGS